jgi:hypothetical protein
MVVRLGRDLPASGAPFTRASVSEAVEAMMAGMEIVDDRYVDYKSMDTPTLIADDFFDAGCVLGAAVTDWPALDLPALTGVTLLDGVEVGRGRGADVMGHPFEALAWLANNLAQRRQHLRAGEFVFTGSVVETKWVNRGQRVTMRIEVRVVCAARTDLSNSDLRQRERAPTRPFYLSSAEALLVVFALYLGDLTVVCDLDFPDRAFVTDLDLVLGLAVLGFPLGAEELGSFELGLDRVGNFGVELVHRHRLASE